MLHFKEIYFSGYLSQVTFPFLYSQMCAEVTITIVVKLFKLWMLRKSNLAGFEVLSHILLYKLKTEKNDNRNKHYSNHLTTTTLS